MWEFDSIVGLEKCSSGRWYVRVKLSRAGEEKSVFLKFHDLPETKAILQEVAHYIELEEKHEKEAKERAEKEKEKREIEEQIDRRSPTEDKKTFWQRVGSWMGG